MKGVLKNAVLGIALVSMLGACSTMTTVSERDTYAEPNWYAKCKQIGSEGGFLFWFGTDYVYSCGKGVSWNDQAAVAQAKSFAYKGVAERIHSNIPMRYISSPEEFAKFIIFIASEDASYLTGSAISIDGGATKSIF